MPEPSLTPIASASELVVRYGTQTVLDRATLTIHEGERIGLVGRNGTGKSTFLRIAAGELEPDSGLFTRQRDQVTGYLPQQFELDASASVHDNILAGARHILGLIDEYEAAPAESSRSAELLDRINHFDGWNLESRARSLINHLHAPDAERLVGTLSGGERRRVALCRALLARPDFLILDEPTNHLDTGSIEWLEDFLARYEGTCLFVTHDRYFLDRIATRIVELSRGVFTGYDGNYTDYLLARAQQKAVEEMQEHKRQRFLKKELEWVRKAPRARRTKSVDRVAQYFEMAAQEAPEQEIDVDLIIPPAPKLANRVIELRGVGVDLGGRTLFDGLDLDLAAGERLGIVGRNGLGKTTLLRVILGQLAPTRGTVEHGARTEINAIDQDRLALDDGKSVWEEVGGGQEHVRIGEETITLRSYLRRFLFTEERINSKIGLLSGGERNRVLLAKILKRGGNVLVLDEPTNDLDLGTLRLLEEALAGFKGSVIVVSHDRYFLNRVCTSILAFEGGDRVHYQPGNYDYYLEKRAGREAARAAPMVTKTEPAAPRQKAERARKLTWKETRELEGIEEVILTTEGEVARLEAMFAAPDFYEKHGGDWQELEARLAVSRAKVPELYARWEELERIRAAAG
jgi:ATP-binding cassette subfamily F protein uup